MKCARKWLMNCKNIEPINVNVNKRRVIPPVESLVQPPWEHDGSRWTDKRGPSVGAQFQGTFAAGARHHLSSVAMHQTGISVRGTAVWGESWPMVMSLCDLKQEYTKKIIMFTCNASHKKML